MLAIASMWCRIYLQTRMFYAHSQLLLLYVALPLTLSGIGCMLESNRTTGEICISVVVRGGAAFESGLQEVSIIACYPVLFPLRTGQRQIALRFTPCC